MQAVRFSNSFAPEHLMLMGYEKSVLKDITNAGSIFYGEFSVEAAGDYCSGTNHVLPTSQFSKARGGLSVYDYLKMRTVQTINKKGLRSLKDTILTLAEMENLPGHANSVSIRFEDDAK
jgi:histidinol dehydrogenase